MRSLDQVDLSALHSLATIAKADELLELEAAEEAVFIRPDDVILGAGNNIFFAGDIKKRVLRAGFSGIEIAFEDEKSVLLKVLAGTIWQEVVEFACNRGLFGIENLAAIPSSAGAAPVQNIGAYGVELASVMEKVRVYDFLDKKFLDIAASDCGFAYRKSNFQTAWKKRFFIVEITLRLNKNGQINANYPGLAKVKTPLEMMRQVIDLRSQKIPDPKIHPNAGSFFHNPLVDLPRYWDLQDKYPDIPAFKYTENQLKVPAAWLIEQCGFKGKLDGKVGISAQHAVILVNYGGTGREILQFAAKVQRAVGLRFGLQLNIEPTVVGEI
ncbi:MAG: UDP-N-acetylmuramate dehydrogenase [Cardiobacteriaceae bacterium]|nr:UDP-N-acetylmuramate dehydrogenase [Cardiobacteriaceae bacterium]